MIRCNNFEASFWHSRVCVFLWRKLNKETLSFLDRHICTLTESNRFWHVWTARKKDKVELSAMREKQKRLYSRTSLQLHAWHKYIFHDELIKPLKIMFQPLHIQHGSIKPSSCSMKPMRCFGLVSTSLQHSWKFTLESTLAQRSWKIGLVCQKQILSDLLRIINGSHLQDRTKQGPLVNTIITGTL